MIYKEDEVIISESNYIDDNLTTYNKDHYIGEEDCNDNYDSYFTINVINNKGKKELLRIF